MLELRIFSQAISGEKLIQVELIELAATGNGQQLIRHLVGKQAHLGQSSIRISLSRVMFFELVFSPLFIGVCPVENLLLDELAGGQCLERGAGEIEVSLGSDRQEFGLFLRKNRKIFIHVCKAGAVFYPGLLYRDRILLTLKQLLGGITPSTKVVFVEHHQIPIHCMQPFVVGLDIPGLVTTKKILKRAEIDNRLITVDLRWIASG